MNQVKRLSKEDYFKVLSLAPVPSIDLIIQRRDGKFLVGRRTNRPAKNWLFTFGGVILKGEKMADAYARITSAELGIELDIRTADSFGTWDHIYHDNFLGVEGVGTHYVVSAYLQRITQEDIVTDDQHSEHQWLSAIQLLQHGEVHDKVKDYFKQLIAKYEPGGVPYVWPREVTSLEQ